MCGNRQDMVTVPDPASVDRDDRIRALRGSWSGDDLGTDALGAEHRRERALEERKVAVRSAARP
jgi:hypothetical protein